MSLKFMWYWRLYHGFPVLINAFRLRKKVFPTFLISHLSDLSFEVFSITSADPRHA